MVSSALERKVADGEPGRSELGVTDSAKSVDVANNVELPNLKDDGHIGHVLKSVYQHTVDEDIPSEMLDLLSKLG